MMLLETWDGITLSRNVAFSKQKMIIENRPHDPKTYQFPRPPDTLRNGSYSGQFKNVNGNSSPFSFE